MSGNSWRKVRYCRSLILYRWHGYFGPSDIVQLCVSVLHLYMILFLHFFTSYLLVVRECKCPCSMLLRELGREPKTFKEWIAPLNHSLANGTSSNLSDFTDNDTSIDDAFLPLCSMSSMIYLTTLGQNRIATLSLLACRFDNEWVYPTFDPRKAFHNGSKRDARVSIGLTCDRSRVPRFMALADQHDSRSQLDCLHSQSRLMTKPKFL